jgi:heme-degrading monooxygenase HmoA
MGSFGAPVGWFARRAAQERKADAALRQPLCYEGDAYFDCIADEEHMLITVFRSRLKPGLRDEYVALVERMNELAKTMPGYISHKGYFADDGERVTIVEFEHEEGLRAWRTNPEHIAAQKLARQKYYTEYHVQVCTLDRESKFKAPMETMAAQS